MSETRKYIFIQILMVLISAQIVSSSGASDFNVTSAALNQSKLDIQEMIEGSLSVARVNDTLTQAQQLFYAQYALMKAGGTPDFSLILERTKEISSLKQKAESMSDEIKTLEASLKNTSKESEAYTIFEKAKKEFADERYDKASDLVDEAYSKINEEQAFQTRFIAIYEAGTKTIMDFLKKRWKMLTYFTVIVVLIYFIAKKRIKTLLIKRNISKLNFEKEIIQKLVKKTQYEYFHLFKIPEESYHIRIEKYAELIRDIDRKIPLLIEEIEKVKVGMQMRESGEKAENYKRRLVFSYIILILILAALTFTLLELKIVSYAKLFYYIEGNLGIFTLVTTTLMVSLAASIIIHRLKEEKQAGKAELVKKPEVPAQTQFKTLKLFIANRTSQIIKYLQSLPKVLEESKQYRKLLKEKKEEENLKIRYLRKQQWFMFKIKLQEKLYSLLNLRMGNAKHTAKTKLVTEETVNTKKWLIGGFIKEVGEKSKAFLHKFLGLFHKKAPLNIPKEKETKKRKYTYVPKAEGEGTVKKWHIGGFIKGIGIRLEDFLNGLTTHKISEEKGTQEKIIKNNKLKYVISQQQLKLKQMYERIKRVIIRVWPAQKITQTAENKKNKDISLIRVHLKETREALMKSDLKAAKNIYLGIMKVYDGLKPSEKAVVYNEIRNIYYDRKKAEVAKRA